MDFLHVKLKKANHQAYEVDFDSKPTWDRLSSKVAEQFQIPPIRVILTYRDSTQNDFVNVTNEEDLQKLYESLRPNSRTFNFVVQDLHNPDPSVSSTWTIDLNLSSLSTNRPAHHSITGTEAILLCWVFNTPYDAFLVTIGVTLEVDDLKKLIKQEMDYKSPHYTLELWKPPGSISSSRCAEELAHFQHPNEIPGCVKLPHDDPVLKHFSMPLGDHLHIIVQCPLIQNALHKPSAHLARRGVTVMGLYMRLNYYSFIQVRGTPASGKTTLAKLLAFYIQQEEPDVIIIWLYGWPENEVRNAGGYRGYLRTKGWELGKKTVFIFDEAQLTHWDVTTWRDFFKNLMAHTRIRAIALTSYGSPNSHIVMEETPIHLADAQTVTLNAIFHNDHLPPVGLYFTKDEMDELVSVRYSGPEHYFHESFFRRLLLLTGGHVGAIYDFVRVIMVNDSYRRLKASRELYTWDTYMKMVRPRDLLMVLPKGSIFARGLPQDNDLRKPDIACIFSQVLSNGYVTDSDFADDEALQVCFRNGWLHADKKDLAGGPVTIYFFPSLLHRWFVEWKLWDHYPPPPIEANDILSFVTSIIQKFSPKRLVSQRKLPNGEVESVPEAQYEAEFYRCCSNGSIVTFPEYGTQQGRVDFYIPAKEWGVELVRDGDWLAEHSGRFSKSGSYSTALPFSDYIILDCRTTLPRDPHPDLHKLFHVVFNDDFDKVSILNNLLVSVTTFGLLGSA